MINRIIFHSRKRFALAAVFLMCFSIGAVVACAPGYSHSGVSGHKTSEMALIPAGHFFQGSSEEMVDWAMEKFFAESREWYRDETPV